MKPLSDGLRQLEAVSHALTQPWEWNAGQMHAMWQSSLIPFLQSVVPSCVHLVIPKSDPLDDAIAALNGFGPRRPEEKHVSPGDLWDAPCGMRG